MNNYLKILLNDEPNIRQYLAQLSEAHKKKVQDNEVLSTSSAQAIIVRF